MDRTLESVCAEGAIPAKLIMGFAAGRNSQVEDRAEGIISYAFCFFVYPQRRKEITAYMIIITNNEKVLERYGASYETVFIKGSYKDVLIEVRDRVHKGQKLLTHPLMGSVKPNETPFKSVVLSSEITMLDVDSLTVIEQSITTHDKFMRMKRPNLGENASESLKDDFREIDLSLLVSALG